MRKKQRVREAPDRAADEKENRVPRVPERVLDRAAEHPEINHVADQMHESAVQKQRRDQRDRDLEDRVAIRRRIRQPRRDVSEDVDDVLGPIAQKDLHEKHDHVRDDERPIDDRSRARSERVAEGDHGLIHQFILSGRIHR